MNLLRSSRSTCSALASALACAALVFVAGCGGDKPAEAPSAQVDVDADPSALLPASAIAYAHLDAKAFFASESFGPDLAKVAEKVSPLGEEAGFLPSRDLDAIYAGVYSTQGADVAAVLVGRFDQAKVKKLAETHTPTRSGGALVVSQYAGRDVYTINNAGFTVLTAKTALVGTETGIRRALDRVKDGRVKHDVPPWVDDTFKTTGAVLAVTFDAQAQPGASELVRQVPLPWAQGVQKARILMDFKAPGANVAGSLAYADEAQAGQAAAALGNTAGFAKILTLVGLQFREFKAVAAKSDVQVTIAVDDQSLRTLAKGLPQWLGLP